LTREKNSAPTYGRESQRQAKFKCAIFGAYMNPRWSEQRSSTATIKATARIREALEWIAYHLIRPENSDAWLALGELEPEPTRIELFDCVWWICFRQVEPVPATAPTSVDQQ
jgi:hypothetical protein